MRAAAVLMLATNAWAWTAPRIPRATKVILTDQEPQSRPARLAVLAAARTNHLFSLGELTFQ